MKRLLILLLALGAPAFAGTGQVTGRVLNKTTGQGAAGVEVRLVKPGENTPDRQIAVTKTGPQGEFSCGPFPVGPEDIYMAQAQWQGFRYETVAFDGTGHLKDMNVVFDPHKLELDIYNTTREAPPLTFQAHHLAIETQDRALKVTERIVVLNPTNETFIGGSDGATVKLDIPKGAKDVTLDDRVGGKLLQTPDGYAVAKAITPQAYQRRNAIILTYTMDWPQSAPWNRKLDLSHKILYPTNFFFIARNPGDKDLKLDAPQLGKEETQEIPGSKGETLTKVVNAIGFPMAPQPALKPGETVTVVFERPINPLVWAFVMFVGALIAIVPLALRGAKKRAGTDDENPFKIKEPPGIGDVLGGTFRPPTPSDSPALSGVGNGFAGSGDAQELVFAIARLDEEFAAGALDKATYQKRRAVWKKQLMDLLS